MSGYAVIDVETTGLHPGWQHRVTEVAVELLDEHGQHAASYETLVDPGRDMGAQDVHGIDAADAALAPNFSDIAGDLIGLIEGRVIVAHNAAFDSTFLRAEFARCGVEMPDATEATLCTMSMASHFLPDLPRTLAACCDAAGIVYTDAHRASSDARAAAHLLLAYMQDEPEAGWWSSTQRAAELLNWPTVRALQTSAVVRGASDPSGTHMQSLIRRIERFTEPPYSAEYFSLLDRVLADGRITATERRELAAFGDVYGLSPDDIAGLHRSYMAAVVRAFTSDQILTQEERARIVLFAQLLGLPAPDTAALLAIAHRDADAVDEAIMLRAGDEVVLTGMSKVVKSGIQAACEQLGVEVQPRVTRKTKLVVALDPNTNSGKAKQARVYGRPVIGVDALEVSLARMRPPSAT